MMQRTRITHTQSIRTLVSTSELEGIQALLHKPHRREGAHQLAQGWPSALFITHEQIELLPLH
jgi:hypothetical protein